MAEEEVAQQRELFDNKIKLYIEENRNENDAVKHCVTWTQQTGIRNPWGFGTPEPP